MPGYTVEALEVTPCLDMELLLENCRETRVAGDVMDRLADYWAEWMPRLKARKIAIGKDSYLAVWLDEAVEDAVDKAWSDAPSEAFLVNSLALTMCMCAVHELVPEVGEAGCAPAPKPTLDLKLALEEQGLRDPDEERADLALRRRYAVATFYPFRGGCDICHLQDECPKLKGGQDYSIVLPGHEQ
jgi:hypothetical protein